MDPSDEQLVRKARDGDKAAYGKLFERLESGAFNFAYSITGNVDDSIDSVEKAFRKLFDELSRPGSRYDLATHLYRETRKGALDTIAARGRVDPPGLIDIRKIEDMYADPGSSSSSARQRARIRKAAASLPENFRIALALRELADMPYEKISNIMGVPENSVGILLLRARLNLVQEFRMPRVDAEKLSEECRPIAPLLSGYIDGELNDEQQVEVSDHLSQCPFCRLAVEETTEASQTYHSIMQLVPPTSLRDRLFAHLAGEEVRPDDSGAERSSQTEQNSKPNEAAETVGVQPHSAPEPQTLIPVAAASGESDSQPEEELAAKEEQTSRSMFRTLTKLAAEHKMMAAALVVVFAWAVTTGVAGLGDNPTRSLDSSTQDSQGAQTTSGSAGPGVTEVSPSDAPGAARETVEAPEPAGPPQAAVPAPPATPQPRETAPVVSPDVAEPAAEIPAAATPAEPAEETKPAKLAAPTSLSPCSGQFRVGETLNLTWATVPDAETYTVEIQVFANDKWSPYLKKKNLTMNRLAQSMVESPERWRVWAVGDGREGQLSSWCTLNSVK